MRRAVAVVGAVLMAGLVLVSCSQPEERASAAPEPEPVVDEETVVSARTRGVPAQKREEIEEAPPRVLLDELTYEWRTSPERGLHVELLFSNPSDSYERARGYVFLQAEADVYGAVVRGVYPWNTRMVEGLPDEYTDGTHLLYRGTQKITAFIPYERSDGQYSRLKLLVFHDDGKLLTNRTYDLEITGTPGASKSIKPGFDL